MTESVITLLITFLTVVIAYVGYEIRKNERARTIFLALEPLAKDAVIASQKLGVTEYLSGSMKKNHAVNSVVKALKDAGYTVKDTEAIKNAVEKAYIEQKSLLEQYQQKKEAS